MHNSSAWSDRSLGSGDGFIQLWTQFRSTLPKMLTSFIYHRLFKTQKWPSALKQRRVLDWTKERPRWRVSEHSTKTSWAQALTWKSFHTKRITTILRLLYSLASCYPRPVRSRWQLFDISISNSRKTDHRLTHSSPALCRRNPAENILSVPLTDEHGARGPDPPLKTAHFLLLYSSEWMDHCLLFPFSPCVDLSMGSHRMERCLNWRTRSRRTCELSGHHSKQREGFRWKGQPRTIVRNNEDMTTDSYRHTVELCVRAKENADEVTNEQKKAVLTLFAR